MRKTSNKNWTISTHTFEISDKMSLRSEIQHIVPVDNITVLAPQPGIGKTLWANRFIEEIIKSEKDINKRKKQNFVVFAKNHKLLAEEYLPKLKEFGAIHWKGFEKMCPDSDMCELYQQFPNPKIICGKICELDEEEKKGCPYHEQFQNKEVVLAPIQMMRENEDRFDNIIIDENFVETSEIKKEYMLARLISNRFQRALKENDSKWIKEHKKMLYVKYNEHMNFLIEAKLWKQVNKFLELDIEDQIFLSERKIEKWYRPALYNIFKNAQNCKIILLCATFDEEYFTDMMKSYAGEFGFDKEITTKIYYTKAQNKNTVVWHINPEHNYRFSEPANMIENMRIIHEKYPDVGCIGRSIFKQELGWGLHYNAAEGSNNFSDAEVFIKINYYIQNIGSMIEEYQQQYMDFDFPKMPKKEDGEDMVRWVKEHGGRKCESFMNWRNESKNYDAIHRNRGLWYDYRSVIVFGIMPKGISEEFTVKEISLTNQNIESFISEIIKETRNKNMQKDEEDKKMHEELLKQHIEDEPITEEEYMNIPEPIEHEPEFN